jgi:hypothetical protein
MLGPASLSCMILIIIIQPLHVKAISTGVCRLCTAPVACCMAVMKGTMDQNKRLACH